MECFLPSEIARMVLGYLKDEGCHKAYKDFLVESAHLHEYATFLQRGVEYPTKIGGKGLVNMLDDYGRIKLYDLHNQPEVIHCLWHQLEQAITQLKYVLCETQAPEFRTKGAVLNSLMKSCASQKRAYSHSMLSLKKSKPMRSNKSVEKPIAVNVGDDQRPSTSAHSPTASLDGTSSQPVTPAERRKNLAYSPSSLAEKPHSVAPSRSPSPELPRMTRRTRLDSVSRQRLPVTKRSDSVSSSGKKVIKLSNVECLREQREALIRGMRTGIVRDAQRQRNNGHPPGHSPATPHSGTGQRHTDVKAVPSSDLLVPSNADGRSKVTSVDGQKACDISSDGVDDCCEHAVAMETGIEGDSHEDDPQDHDLELDLQTAPSEGVSLPQSVLKTPVKRLLVEENSRDPFRSPRRKSQAPKRRTISGPTGTDREVIGETVAPPGSIVLPIDQHSSDSCDNVFSMPVLDELINSRLFAERLAENINKVKLSVESTPTDKPAACSSAGATTTSASTATSTPQGDKMVTKTLSPAESPVKMVEKTDDGRTTVSSESTSAQDTGQVSLEEDPSMSDAAVNGIIALTQNDPDFDAIFSNLFGIDFSGTDIMGEMTSLSTSTVLSTNQNAADAILQNDMVIKHDFSSSATGRSMEPVSSQPEVGPSTKHANTSFDNAPTTSDAPMSQNEGLLDHNVEQSATFSSSVQDKNVVELTHVSQNSGEMKAPNLVPGSFVQIYHVSEDGSTGYYETVQVVSSGDDGDIKISAPLTNSEDIGQRDTQDGSCVVDHDVGSVRSTGVVTQYHVTRSKDSVSMTTTDTCSSPQSSDVNSEVTSVAPSVTPSAPSTPSASDQSATLIMPSGETYILPAGSDIISRLANGEKLQSTSPSQNAMATTSVTHDIISETEMISPHFKHEQILPASGERHPGNNPVHERTATNDVDIIVSAHTPTVTRGMCDHLDAGPHTPSTNTETSDTLPPIDTDKVNGSHSFMTIDSQALEALRNYDSASPSPAKVTPKTQTRKTKASRNRAGILNQAVRTLGSKTRTSQSQLAQVVNIKDCITMGTPVCVNTCTGVVLCRPVTTCSASMSCMKKTSSFQNTVLSREKWQAKIHDGHWTLVNERMEKRKYLGVPNKRSSQTFKTDATVVPAAMTTAAQWQCLSQNGALSSTSGGQRVGGDCKGPFSVIQGAVADSECNVNNMTGFRIQNGVTTVSFSQSVADEKHKLSLGSVTPYPVAVSDIAPLEMAGAYETMSKVASNTAAIKVTCALAKDRSWTADINTVLDLISPKANGAVTKQIIDNDVTQVSWAVASAGMSSHVRTLNFDLRSCVTNAETREKRLANTLSSHATDACVSQQIYSPQHRQTLSNSHPSNLVVTSKSHEQAPSLPTVSERSEQSPNPETQRLINVTNKTCILSTSAGESRRNCSPGNNSTTKQTTVSVCSKDGATSLKPRDVCRRPARRVAMKTIKRADEILAERSLARKATHVAPSTVHNNEMRTDKCVVGKESKTDTAMRHVASSERGGATYKSVSAIQSARVGGALPNGFTTVCESEVAEALVAFATSVVITPVKNPPTVTCIHPSKSASRDTVRHVDVDSVKAPKCSTPLGQPPPLSSAASPVTVPCKLMSSTASPVSVQCKHPSSTMSPVSVRCKHPSSTMSPVSVQCKHPSSTMSPVSVQCKHPSSTMSPVSVQCKHPSSTMSPVSVQCKHPSSTMSPVSVRCKHPSSTMSPVSVLCKPLSVQCKPVSSTASSAQCKVNVSSVQIAQQTASLAGVNGDVTRPSSCVTRPSSNVTLKQGKRMLDVEGRHSVKPKRTRLRKRPKSLTDMDVDKFLSVLHAK